MNSLSDDDVINMQYTSGTTGFPKGVMLTHHNIVNNARMVGDVMGMTEKDTLLIQVPMFHCFGCVMSTLNCIYHGSTMVILEYLMRQSASVYRRGAMHRRQRRADHVCYNVESSRF